MNNETINKIIERLNELIADKKVQVTKTSTPNGIKWIMDIDKSNGEQD